MRWLILSKILSFVRICEGCGGKVSATHRQRKEDTPHRVRTGEAASLGTEGFPVLSEVVSAKSLVPVTGQ